MNAPGQQPPVTNPTPPAWVKDLNSDDREERLRGLYRMEKEVGRLSARERAGLGDAVPGLVRLLTEPRGTDRALAAQLLGKLGPTAAPAVPALVKVFTSENTSVNPQDHIDRLAAVLALGQIGPKAEQAAPDLVDALVDAVLFRQATEALVGIGEPAVPVLIKALDDPRVPTAPPNPSTQRVDPRLGPPVGAQAAIILGRIGKGADQAVPRLLKLLDSNDVQTVRSGLKALQGFGPAAKQAIPAVEELERHPNGSIRAEASKTLDALRGRAIR
jgi:HEAT repeat protein